MSAEPPTELETATGINRLEGYLLYQAELRTARTQAHAFAERMPWLTRAQCDEVIRHYTDDRLAQTKTTLQQVTRRCHELEQQYSAHYRQLRQQLLRTCVATLLFSATLFIATLGLTFYS